MLKNFCVVGDGQLSRYLCEAAKKLNYKTHVIGQPSSPASVFADKIYPSIQELSSLPNSLILTFENEYFDQEQLSKLIKNRELQIHPDQETIETLSNKLNQKKLLKELNLPTAKFLQFDERYELDEFLDQCKKQLGPRFVLKWAKGGYDSKGVFFIDKKTSIKDLKNFCDQARQVKSEIYAELSISFVKEFAVVMARDAFSNFSTLPVIETKQEQGICREVRPLYASESIKRVAKSITEYIMNYWDYQGVLAIEFFLDRLGNILVNEIAPRVHNSGHFSMLASKYSQFDLHVLSVVNNKLPRSNPTKTHFAMWNLIGPKNSNWNVNVTDLSDIDLSTGLKLYWYDKTVIRAKRKMGHICIVAKSTKELNYKLSKAKEWELKFWTKIKEKNRML